MKKYTIITFALAAVLVFYSTSCSDYVDGVNVSPNSATDAPVESIVIAAQTNLMGLVEGENARLASMWTQQFTGFERQYLSYEEYIVSSELFSWFQPYVGVAGPVKDGLDKLSTVPGSESAQGMLKVMNALMFGNQTALFGDIPYSEANQPEEFPSPKYDPQSSVYASLQALLTDAITDLSKGPISTSDILGNKNAANWTKVAHTLKARFFLHVKDYSSAMAEAALGLQPGDYGLIGTHGTVPQANDNLWWNFIEFSRSGYLTASNAYLPRLLDASDAIYRGNAKTDESERFQYYYDISSGSYIANVDNDGLFAQDASFPLLTGYENALIMAEAQLRDGSPDEAAALAALNSVRAQLAVDYPNGQYDAYVLTDFDPTGIAGAAGKTRQQALMDEIIEEKYSTLVGQIEIFNDFRRLKNPMGLTPRGTAGLFPERFLIPTSEVNSNANAPSPIPDLFTPTAVNSN